MNMATLNPQPRLGGEKRVRAAWPWVGGEGHYFLSFLVLYSIFFVFSRILPYFTRIFFFAHRSKKAQKYHQNTIKYVTRNTFTEIH